MKHILPNGWEIDCIVDEDNHLNIYIKNADGSDILECETGQGNGVGGEPLALRLSTKAIEKGFAENQRTDILSLPLQNPAPEQEIIIYQLAGIPRAKIFDTQTRTRGMISKALCPTDKELLGIPPGDVEHLYTKEHISKLILGNFYGPEIAAKYHDDLFNELLLPILKEEGGRISSQDIYEWLQDKMEVEQDSGLAPR